MARTDARIRFDARELTERQREVLGLLARGMTNPQIAERLGITLDGAKFHDPVGATQMVTGCSPRPPQRERGWG